MLRPRFSGRGNRLLGSAVLSFVLTQAWVEPVHGQNMAVNGMVVTQHPIAAQAGLRILQQGGNAFDAAVATAAVMAVVEQPVYGGIGGCGGYALIYDSKTKQVRALDFIGTAPVAATLEMYTKGTRLWDRAHLARDSFIAPTVPGALAGWAALLEEYGTLSWPEVLAPAIEYAEKGFVVTPKFHQAFGRDDIKIGHFPYGAQLFYHDGEPWPVGHVLKQPDLAMTFRAIAEGGPEVFYGGAIAERFVEYFAENGGIFTVEDFANYRARWSEPLAVTYREDYTVYSQPPGGGGMTVLQALNILEQFDLAAPGHNSPEFVHWVTEALKLAFVDDDRFNTGKDHAEIPLDRLLSKAYGEEQAAGIDASRAQFYPPVRPGTPFQSEDTTNHVVVDRDHNMVTITQTSMFPMVTVPGTGVVFNSGMTYFSLDPDDINRIEGAQRPRFVMSPTIVLRRGRPFFALGAAGGWTINQTVLQVILRALDFEMDAHEAVSAPRFVIRYLRNSIPYMPGTTLDLEKGFSDATRAALEAKGHSLLEPVGSFGGLNAIMIYPRTGTLSSGADPRREGQAAGW